MTTPDQSGNEFLSGMELPESLAVVDSFDEAQSIFFKECVAFVDEPTVENIDNVTASLAVMVKTFRDSVRSVANSDCSTDEKALQLTTLIVDEDLKRMDLFQRLTQNEKFIPIQPSAKDQMAESLEEGFSSVEEPDELVEGLIKGYTKVLTDEVADFLELIPLQEEPEYYTSRDILKIIGKNAIDVGKIGIGVALGIMATRRMRI